MTYRFLEEPIGDGMITDAVLRILTFLNNLGVESVFHLGSATTGSLELCLTSKEDRLELQSEIREEFGFAPPINDLIALVSYH